MHSVGFYSDESYLASQVTDFLQPGLKDGAAAVVIAAEPHRRKIGQRLASADASRLVWLDAQATLDRFMVEGWPDESRFREIMGGVIEDAGRLGNGEVRAFGEMVALLWNEGRRDAALRVEELWNELSRKHRFNLHCAYPLSLFSSADAAPGFRAVCDHHEEVHPAESHPQRHPQLGRVMAELQQRSRALEAEVEQRRLVERALIRREAELSDFLENAAEGLHKVGPDGTILWANRAELELLGYAAHEYVGRNIAEFHVDKPGIAAILQKLQNGCTLYDQPATLRCKDGSHKHVLIHSNVLFEDGRFVHTRCFTRDVTEQVRLQRQLEEKLAQLESADRAKERFISILSHELRNPLAPIVTAVELMQESDDPALLKHATGVLDRQVKLIRRLVDDLLDVARIRSGKLSLKREPVAVAAVIADAIELADPLLKEHGHQLTVNVQASLTPIHGDRARLSQALGNLLSNAAKYTPPTGRVEISAQQEGRECVISVTDNGIGLTQEQCRGVFEMFVQVRGAGELPNGGLGLGLSVVRTIAELHGGAVSAHSDGIGRGSRFTLRLPREAPSAVRAA